MTLFTLFSNATCYTVKGITDSGKLNKVLLHFLLYIQECDDRSSAHNLHFAYLPRFNSTTKEPRNLHTVTLCIICQTYLPSYPETLFSPSPHQKLNYSSCNLLFCSHCMTGKCYSSYNLSIYKVQKRL